MSLSTATLVGTVANWALLVSLLGGVLSTFVIVKTADVKEEHWAEDRRQSAERIAALTTQGDQLRKDTAEANRIAEGEKLARLKLEEKLAPRTLDEAQQGQLTTEMAPYSGTALDVFIYGGGSADALPLSGMICDALRAAGWNVRIWNPISPSRWVRGILIQTKAESDRAVEDPAVALIFELRKLLGDGVSGYEHFHESKHPPEGGLMGPPWEADKQAPIRMLIGSKP